MGLKAGAGISVTNLIGTSIKAIRKEFQMANSSDLSRHLDDSEELRGLQAPQMQVVGFASSSQDPAVSTFKKQNRNSEGTRAGSCLGSSTPQSFL